MKILFGSIITSGRGKIGGQFVKRIRGGHSLNNLPSSKSKPSLLNFSNVKITAFIFKTWQLLAQNERDEYTYLAATYPVLDKFGNSKNLTARQFFSKIQLQGWAMNQLIVTPFSFTTVVRTSTITLNSIETGAHTIYFSFTTSETPAYYYLRVDKLPSNGVNARYKNSKVLTTITAFASTYVNIFPYIAAKYTTLLVGDRFQVVFTPLNSFGWLGVPEIFTIVFDDM